MSDLLVTTLRGTMQLKTILSLQLWTRSGRSDPDRADPLEPRHQCAGMRCNRAVLLTIETFNATIDDEPVQPGDPSPGHYVGLAVIDTGAGIADDVLPRVFEPFFTTKAPGKGSGLGLAQVFGFVKQSAVACIETRIGRGTSVKIFLPCSQDIPEERGRTNWLYGARARGEDWASSSLR